MSPTRAVRASRGSLRAGAALVAGGLLALVSAAASGADGTPAAYVATALADGGRFTLTVPAFAIVEDVIDGGGAVSQAVVDSFGSTSFASLPYPGEVAIAGPGLFQAVTGQPAPGSYPFYARASYPTAPKGEVVDPTGLYRLTATAGQGSAQGDAALGSEVESGASSGSHALSSARWQDKTLVATAETINEGLSLGDGALRIASVHSRSVTTYQAGKKAPTTETALVVQGVSAGGTSFDFGPNGAAINGQALPVPTGTAIEQLNKALGPAGMSVRFIGAAPITGGTVAQAFEVTLHAKSPNPGVPDLIARLRFGGASTSVVLGGDVGLGNPTEPVTDVGVGVGVGVGEGTFAPPPSVEPVGGTESDKAVPAAGRDDKPGMPSGSTGTVTSVDVGPVVPAPPDAEASPGEQLSAAPTTVLAESAANSAGTGRGYRPLRASAGWWVYAAFPFGGLVMLGAGLLWRSKGVFQA